MPIGVKLQGRFTFSGDSRRRIPARIHTNQPCLTVYLVPAAVMVFRLEGRWDRMLAMPIVRIGVTGHRVLELDTHEMAGLEAKIDQLFDAIVAASPPATLFELVSCCASGADLMVMKCAQARGWAHDAVLPFPAEDYAADFLTTEVQQQFHDALASVRHTFALCGDRTGSGAVSNAYDRAGRVMLAQSDILLGIWDGTPARGPGGTADVIARAVAEGIPVIHLDPRGSEAVLLWRQLNVHDHGEISVATVARAGLDRLEFVLAALPGIGPRSDCPMEAPVRPRLAACLGLPYRWLLAIAGNASKSIQPDLPKAVQIPSAITSRFARSDQQASEASAAFRGAYVANFSLAAAAVLVSLSGLLLPHGLKPLLLAAELTMIVSIIAITHFGNRLEWHRRWIEQRQLAEWLRCFNVSVRLGDLGLRSHGIGTAPAVREEACLLARRAGLPNAVADQDWLETVRSDLWALVSDQRGYFAREASKMHRLEHRLHRAGTWLFAATALICIGFLGVEVVPRLFGSTAIAEETLHRSAVLVTIATAAFPAIGAAIYGIRMQGDFAGIAERSQATGMQLAALETRIADDPAEFDALHAWTRCAALLLTEDLDNWTHSYQARPLALPG